MAYKLFLFLFVGPGRVAYESRVASQFALRQDIGVLLVGVICGAVVGVFLDCQSSLAPQQTAKDGE